MWSTHSSGSEDLTLQANAPRFFTRSRAAACWAIFMFCATATTCVLEFRRTRSVTPRTKTGLCRTLLFNNRQPAILSPTAAMTFRTIVSASRFSSVPSMKQQVARLAFIHPPSQVRRRYMQRHAAGSVIEELVESNDWSSRRRKFLSGRHADPSYPPSDSVALRLSTDTAHTNNRRIVESSNPAHAISDAKFSAAAIRITDVRSFVGKDVHFCSALGPRPELSRAAKQHRLGRTVQRRDTRLARWQRARRACPRHLPLSLLRCSGRFARQQRADLAKSFIRRVVHDGNELVARQKCRKLFVGDALLVEGDAAARESQHDPDSRLRQSLVDFAHQWRAEADVLLAEPD